MAALTVTDSPDGLNYAKPLNGSFFFVLEDSWTLSGEFSVCYWFRNPDTVGGPARPFVVRGNLEVDDFYIELLSTNLYRFPGSAQTYTGPAFNDNAWHYVSFWRDGDGYMYLYVDDILVNTNNEMSDVSWGGGNVLIGYTSPDRYTVVDIYDFRLYDKKMFQSTDLFAYDDMLNNSGNRSLPFVES